MRILAMRGVKIAVRCGLRANRLATGVLRQSCCARKGIDHGPAALALVLRLPGYDTRRAGRESGGRRVLRQRFARSSRIDILPAGTTNRVCRIHGDRQ